jgi:hypothetical protein
MWAVPDSSSALKLVQLLPAQASDLGRPRDGLEITPNGLPSGVRVSQERKTPATLQMAVRPPSTASFAP